MNSYFTQAGIFLFSSKLPYLSFLLIFLLNFSTNAQHYSYVHYDVKDGLAGSTVYQMCQDRDGFIWFATEAGVSRFDGTHFRNFSTADGLPEMEILRIFADSWGRIWMAPFNNSVCYYYKGKIYTDKNDPQLKKIKLRDFVTSFIEDSNRNMILWSDKTIFTVWADSSGLKDITMLHSYKHLRGIGTGFSQKSIFLRNDSIFKIADGKAMYLTYVPFDKKDSFFIKRLPNQKDLYIKIPPKENIPSFTGNMLFVNTFYGSWLVDPVTWNRYADAFLPGKCVNSVVVDNENNFWFGTGGEGVYKLISREIKTWHFKNGQSFEVFSLEKQHDTLIAGSDKGRVYILSKSGIDTIDFDRYHSGSSNPKSGNKLVCIKRSGNQLLFGFDAFLVKYNLSSRKYLVSNFGVLKSMDELNKDSILVGTGRGAFLVNTARLAILDTIWPFRSTAVAYYNNDYYIGTVGGLYRVTKNKSVHFLGDSLSPLRSRIACMIPSPDGSLWIATYGNGLIQMQGDRLISHITMEKGLSSNICRTLFLRDNFLWIGTDKGINKLDLLHLTNPVMRYSTTDGMPSNIIHAIYVDSNKVYAGSPGGLTYFDESRISTHSKSDLKILDITVSGRSRPRDSLYHLKYTENNLKISFVGISFKSGGDILYRYRLKGLKDTWDSTRQTTLEYPTLPSGEYELELVAINKFGIASTPVKIPFLIATPFWQTAWFKLGIIAAAVIITWLLVTRRYRILRRREQEKTALRQKMNDLEQLALRSQMNPHFIFNCLNSIQSFIIDNEFETTNQYLTEFAHLIRQTLDNSTKGTITLDNEISYLTRYLKMEKMRFENSFDYHFHLDPGIDTEFTYLPSMILQPYVENSIRHGIRYRKDNNGLIEIKFQQKSKTLICIIQDNGIGIQKAKEHRSKSHVEYQSKGMSLTAERIKVLNRELPDPITIDVVDLLDLQYQPAGTKIIIHFPHTILTKSQPI